MTHQEDDMFGVNIPYGFDQAVIEHQQPGSAWIAIGRLVEQVVTGNPRIAG